MENLYFDLHRHDEFSLFDGFGKAGELAEYAKELGYKALGISNHGNTHGLVRHHDACIENGIKPILGCEGYFLPVYKERERGYHLCLFAKNTIGLQNLNTLQFEGEKIKFYNPIWTFEMLEKYHEGLICSSACVAGYLAKCILSDKLGTARKYLRKMVAIFGDDFYVEIQPYSITDEGVQEKVNEVSMGLAEELNIKCILTSDSHRGRKEDFDTYLKMHEIGGHSAMDIGGTYKDRYMPSQEDIVNRFVLMHGKHLGMAEAKSKAFEYCKNLNEIQEKIDNDIFADFTEDLPVFEPGKDSKKTLIEKVKQGLKDRGKYTKEYIERAKRELDTIFYLHFEDYFLMVQDYIVWAKSQGIYVGPGRGSCCNFIVNYALRITEVDSLYFDLEPNRFLMKERHKMPDIDIDFETARRGEVIAYLLEKYKGHSARVCSYGLYKVDNLVNDLAQVCGLKTSGKELPAEQIQNNKRTVSQIKSFIGRYDNEGDIELDKLSKSEEAKMYNKQYDNIIKHFCKLYCKVRFIGTHAAGVAISKCNILERAAMKIDSTTNELYTAYDLEDVNKVKIIKFDMLGLTTMSEIGECRKLAGIDDFKEYMLTDKSTLEAFKEGDANGVFQFDRKSVQQLLRDVNISQFKDIVAVSAMNRPNPLAMGMPKIYADNKAKYERGEKIENSYFEKYLGKTYGTIIYQEQIMKMMNEMAGMTWDEAHFAVSKVKRGYQKFQWYFDENYPRFEKQFLETCKKLNIPEKPAKDTFYQFFGYSFNEGHSVGYSLISAEQMYYKVHYPTFYWYSKLKYAKDEDTYNKFCAYCARDNVIIFLPHVNYSLGKTSIRKVDGEDVLQQGLSDVKQVGLKAATEIVLERKKNGIFTSFDNFYDRCKSRVVTSRVIDTLKEQGALEFKKNTYISRVVKYNSSLVSRSSRV